MSHHTECFGDHGDCGNEARYTIVLPVPEPILTFNIPPPTPQRLTRRACSLHAMGYAAIKDSDLGDFIVGVFALSHAPGAVGDGIVQDLTSKLGRVDDDKQPPTLTWMLTSMPKREEPAPPVLREPVCGVPGCPGHDRFGDG